MPERAAQYRAMRWVTPETDEAQEQQIEELAHKLRTGKLIARLLINRGINNAEAARSFLQPKLNDLHDPEMLSGCTSAAKITIAAVEAGSPITIYGDYDVDGMTATAILYRALKLIGAQVDYYIPHRVDEGYGLNVEAIEKIAKTACKLVITVDCGINSLDCAARAAELGMELVISDHHAPGSELPHAAAIVHPHLADYPNPNLCGAGVALKLAWQILREKCRSKRVSDNLKDFLLDATCMAAIGTVADIVELSGENRALVSHGLRGIATSGHSGLQALVAASGVAGKKVGEYDVGFAIAPRLNAAGRMGHAELAADLLIKPEEIDPTAVAGKLTSHNEQRKKLEAEIFQQALEQVESASDFNKATGEPAGRFVVAHGNQWHPGVVGIVASRLVERYKRPTLVLAIEGNSARGSARSIPGFNMIEALRQCENCMEQCGGHAMAAGVRLDSNNIDELTQGLKDIASQQVSDDMLRPTLRIDATVRLEELSLPMVRQIAMLGPFGAGNPKVMLAVQDAVIHSAPRRIGSRGTTLSLLLAAGKASARNARIKCIGFGMAKLLDHLAGVREVTVAGEPSIDTYTGREQVQMLLKDITWH